MTRPQRVAAAGAAAVALLLVAGCSLGVQSAANDEAASIADRYLPGAIDAELAGLESGDDPARAALVQSWLDESNPDGIEPLVSARWSAGPRSGTTVPVVVHYHLGETTLSDDAWGLACRDYVVGDRVEVIATPCPEGTPQSPYPPGLLED